MKPILTFVFGAVGAALLVYLLMRPGSIPEKTAAPESITATAPAASETPEPAIPDSPSTAEPARPVTQTPVSEPRKSPTKTAPPRKTPAPSLTQPSTTAENRTTPPVSIPPVAEPQTSVLTPSTSRDTESSSRAESRPARVPQKVTIPAGTSLSVRIDQMLSSKNSQLGDTFRASLDQPLVVDGFVIAERGAPVEGKIASVDPGGRVKGRATIGLELVRLNTSDGQRLRLQTDNFVKQAASDTKGDVGKVGIAAGIGAAIGAIAGGGRGAAIGAAAGGAAGTGGVMATRGKAAEVPAETRMVFKLRDSIVVTEKLP